jgi:protein HIRA/HIR1
LDGSVANFHFEAKELGYRLSDSELDELKRSRYGDVRGRQSNLAESPAQLLLEETSAKQSSAKQSVSKKGTSVVQQFQAPPKVSADVPNPAPVVQSQKAPEALPEDGKKTSGPAAVDINKVTRLSSPVKQREYRRPDGRKRIIPEAVGFPSNQDNIPSSSQNQVVDFSSLDQRMNGTRPSYGGSGNCGVKDRSGVTARANITESLVIQKASTGAGNEGRLSIEHTGTVVPGSLTCSVLSIHVSDKKENEYSLPVCLEAKPVERAAADTIGVGGAFSTKETEIRCARGTETLWSDRISGKVTALAGNANFWAVGCEDGCLQVGIIPYQNSLLIDSFFQYGFSFCRAHMQPHYLTITHI